MTAPSMIQSIDTQTIVGILAQANAGEVIRYDVLSAAIGRDVTNGARHILQSAMKDQQRDGRVWQTVRNEGVQLLSAAQIAEGAAESLRKRVGSAAKRERSRVQCAFDDPSFDTLDEGVKLKAVTAASLASMFIEASKKKVLNRLEAKCSEQGGKSIPYAHALEAMK